MIDPKAHAYATNEAKCLIKHLDEWHKWMLARNKTQRHADQFLDRTGKLIAIVNGENPSVLDPGRKADSQRQAADTLMACLKKARFSHLKAEKIQSALAALRDIGKSHQTINHYRSALRCFLIWACDTGRIRDNPIKGVDGYNAEEDPRHTRRALSDDELVRLVKGAETGPTIFGMSGSLRAMAYRVAASTGFRVSELRRLTPESFRLEGKTALIYLSAGSTKNRKSANQPIPAALASDLRAWLAGKTPGVSVFPLHHETAKAICRDLERVGIAYVTEEGVADFHSLRAYYVSALVRTGASIKAVQSLARHAKPEPP